MTDDLYERYKEALRVGHVAVLRGALEEAISAYRTAASIAPSRGLPHTSLGGVLLRLGHLEEALVEYAAAVARAPHDEGALLGQAEALTMAGQRVDAATALDHVSEIQEAAGRLPEAADTLRRAMELEESVERSRRQRGLLRQIRLSAGDQAAEQLLAKALRLRDEPAPAPAVHPLQSPLHGPEPAKLMDRMAAHAAVPAAVPAAAPEPVASEVEPEPEPEVVDLEPVVVQAPVAAAEPEPEPESQTEPEPAPEPESVPVMAAQSRAIEWPSADLAGRTAPAPRSEPVPSEPEWPAADSDPQRELAPEPQREPEPEPALVAVAAAAPEAQPSATDLDAQSEADRIAAAEAAAPQEALVAVGVMDGAIDSQFVGVGESAHQPTGDELLKAAEAAEVSGDIANLRSLLLWTARAYAREGRFEAGLDATHRILQREPSDVDAHLVLVELYVALDWNSLAADKLVLLGRLAQLNNDLETHKRLATVANRSFPKDERLAAMFN
jgi:hypothetical protein